MSKFNFAILGTGGMAATMANTIVQMPHVNAYAVASRTQKKANDFAARFGFEKSYASYEELVSDPAIDLVYIATPHSCHYENAMLCLHHNKPILLEKAFTANALQAKEIIKTATEKNIFVAEALFTRYMPIYKTLQELIQGGTIGTPTMMQASFGLPLTGVERITSPELAGGALLDLGIYPINLACIAFGSNIASISSCATMYPTGVDAYSSFALQYPDGKMASLQCSMVNHLDGNATICGSQGFLRLDNQNNCSIIEVYNAQGQLVNTIERPPVITGYEYEVNACIQALQNKQIQCDEMPHSETIQIMEIMDFLRRQWNFEFPFEQKTSPN